MKKQLFFDDWFLFGRENVERKYGKPQLLKDAIYTDGVYSTDFCTGNVFRIGENKWRMLYFGKIKQSEGMKLFAAQSDDGIHFTPEAFDGDYEKNGKRYPHEIMTLLPGWEVASVYEDPLAPPQARYKLLMSEYSFDELYVHDFIYVSPDLLHWTKTESKWAEGTEPIAGAFFNHHKQCHTFVTRPFWGVRTVGYRQTKDWKENTPFAYCLRVDSLDEPMMEIYGMTAFAYDGMYIGFPHTYRGARNLYGAKYDGGIMDAQLAYSYDGEYWQRSLRQPFISGVYGEKVAGVPDYKLLWTSSMQILDDGNVYLYASGSELEHGPAFEGTGTGKIFVYKLRRDGFIYMETQDKSMPSKIVTREKLWESGELHVNIAAKRATVAVYTSADPEKKGNPLGIATPLEGYTHEDCIPFSGDNADWTPQYKNGKKLSDLAGETLVFEVKFEDGCLYSIFGEYADIMNTEGERYRLLGVLPEGVKNDK